MSTSQLPKWIPDEDATECMKCTKEFGLITRRHHCRNCGRIFCGKCASQFVVLKHLGLADKQRVCAACHATVTSGQQGTGVGGGANDQKKPWHVTRVQEDTSTEQKRIDFLSTKIANDPKNPILYNNRGLAYCYCQRYDEALKDFDQAIKLVVPTNRNVIAHVTFNRAAWTYLKMNKFQLTIQECNKGLEMQEDAHILHHKFLNTRAVAHDSLGQTDKAIEDYTLAIEKKPRGQYYANRGTVYRQLANYADAEKDFEKSLEFEPERAAFYHNRAILSIDLGRDESALADLTKVLEWSPTFIDALTTRALLYCDLGKLDLALKDVSDCLDVDDSTPAAYATAAIVYAKKGDKEKAMEHFTKATEGWEEIYHYKKMFYKGILHMELEEFDEALSAFNESWKLKNKEYHSIGHKILARRAYCNIKLGNRTEAEQDLKLALFYAPKHPRYLAWKALIGETEGEDGSPANAAQTNEASDATAEDTVETQQVDATSTDEPADSA